MGGAVSEHTKEPWRVEDLIEIWGDDNYLFFIAQLNGFDARRIVACVNACAGLSNEYLENTQLMETLLKLGAID